MSRFDDFSGFADFGDVAQVRNDVLKIMDAPDRTPVADCAEKHYRVRTSSGGNEHWQKAITPYMVEPMNAITSEYEAVAFIGPARSGKTGALLGIVSYTSIGDPADTMVVHMSQDKASKFRKKEIRRLFEDSPSLNEVFPEKIMEAQKLTLTLKHGNVLNVAWPSVTQLSAETIKYVLFTDYDRMPLNVSHEGSPFALGKKRTQTFLSRGSVFVETSPGFEVSNPLWEPESEHEAPPAKGGFEIYNLGTRKRWYWPCPECKTPFMEPKDYSGFSYNHERDDKGYTMPDRMGRVSLICPHCGVTIDESNKLWMLANGFWVKDPEVKSAVEYDTYWLSGAAARYQSWQSLVKTYLNAERTFDTTANEEPLRNAYNLDMGAAYLPKVRQKQAAPDEFRSRQEKFPRGIVPEGVRFLLADIDVQAGKDTRFEVQVLGFGAQLESWVIDRFSIREYRDGDVKGRIKPQTYKEHWDMIRVEVLDKSYPLSDGSGRRMRILRTGCDMLGADGVSEHAYAFYEKLLTMTDQFGRVGGYRGRFVLCQGQAQRNRQMGRVNVSYPDSTGKGQRSNAGGRIPVLQFQTDKLKDEVYNEMQRTEPGPGYMHWPDWLKKRWFQELTAEFRDDIGWKKRDRRDPNETFDLYVQAKALCINLGTRSIEWANPSQTWARHWDDNSEVYHPDRTAKLIEKMSRPTKSAPQSRRRTRVRFSNGR